MWIQGLFDSIKGDILYHHCNPNPNHTHTWWYNMSPLITFELSTQIMHASNMLFMEMEMSVSKKVRVEKTKEQYFEAEQPKQPQSKCCSAIKGCCISGI